MLIKALSEKEFDRDFIERIEAPAFLLDSNFCVAALNTDAALTLSGIREGIGISKFLSDSAAEAVAMMISQEICTVDVLLKEAKRSATVVCGKNSRLFVVSENSGLEKDVFEALGELSGYDMELIRARENRNSLFEMALQLRAEQFVPRRLPFFSAATALYALQEQIYALRPDVCSRINFNYIDSEGYAKGSERDFALIAVALVSALIPQSNGDVLDISMTCDKENMVLRFSGAENAPPNFKDVTEMHLRLLAEGNMWEMTKDRNGGYCLIMPFVKSGEEFTVRDVSAEFLRVLVAVVFGARNG